MNKALHNSVGIDKRVDSIEIRCLMDAQGCIRTIDEAVNHLLGWDVQQCIGKMFIDLFRIPGHVPFNALRQFSKQSGFRFEVSADTQDGKTLVLDALAKQVDADVTVALTYQPNAFPNALIGILVEKDQQFERALSLVSVGYWVWHIQSEKIIWSDECFNLLGLDPKIDEPALASYMEAIHPDDRAYVQQNVGLVMQAGNAPDLEHRLKRRDGSVIHVKSRAQLILGDDGKPSYLFGTIQDVTVQREYELALQRAKQVAEQANLAKTQFLSRVSHEFRTPLNAVVGNAELLGLELDGQFSDFLTDLKDGCQQLENMLTSALDITSIDQMMLKIEPVDLVSLLGDFPVSMEGMLTKYQISMRVEPQSLPSLYVQTDAMRVRQILMHLLSNAIKYNKPLGNVTLALRKQADEALFEVTDCGLGIAAEDQERIFLPFERIVAEENIIPGTGLGLTLSRELAKLLGGTVRCTSEPGVGSRFTLALPL